MIFFRSSLRSYRARFERRIGCLSIITSHVLATTTYIRFPSTTPNSNSPSSPSACSTSPLKSRHPCPASSFTAFSKPASPPSSSNSYPSTTLIFKRCYERSNTTMRQTLRNWNLGIFIPSSGWQSRIFNEDSRCYNRGRRVSFGLGPSEFGNFENRPFGARG